MTADLFISYAWTSPEHREWVRLLASGLHLLGYDVRIDAAVDYGSSLSGFMREVVNAKHVLLVVDANYVDRADNRPLSGVGVETEWISRAHPDKPSSWLSVLWVRNPERLLPSWMTGFDPKGFDFNSEPSSNDFPGSVQVNELWRWIEGLPASTSDAVPLAELRKRTARLERADLARDPGQYASPTLSGRVTFRHRDHTHYTIGYDEYEFPIQFSGRSFNGVYVYGDAGLKSLGLITAEHYEAKTVESFLTPGRLATPDVGQSVILMNNYGALCVIKIEEVQREINERTEYIPEHVVFSYQVLVAESEVDSTGADVD